MYLTLSQTSKELDRTERQVRYLVKTHVLLPANQDTYRRDGGYRFLKEEVIRVKGVLEVEGLTLRVAAHLVGKTPQYLNSLALNGKINSELVLIGHKKERRFKEKDCLALKCQLDTGTHKSVAKYGEKLHLFSNHVRLFELVSYKEELVRVVKTQPLTLLKNDGSMIQPNANEITTHLETWPDLPYKTKKGFISFNIPIPRFPEHATYNTLYELIEGIGPKNVQVFEKTEGDYMVRCRQGKLPLKRESYDLLQRYIIEGKLHYSNNEALLKSEIISQTIHLPRELYEKIEKIAIERSVSTQEQIIQTVVQGLKSLEKKERNDVHISEINDR